MWHFFRAISMRERQIEKERERERRRGGGGGCSKRIWHAVCLYGRGGGVSVYVWMHLCVCVCVCVNHRLSTVKTHTALNGLFSFVRAPIEVVRAYCTLILPACTTLKGNAPSQTLVWPATLPRCARELTANLVFCSWATLFGCKCRPANFVFNWSSVHLNWGNALKKTHHCAL